MLMAVRIYGSEANAREAARKLVEAGIRKDLIHVMTPGSGAAEQAVKAAISAKKLPSIHEQAALAALGNGRSIVSVPLPYYGQETLDILDSCDPVETESLPAMRLANDPAPFSDMLGFRVLTSGGGPSTRLLHSGPSFKSFLGLPLLTRSSGSKNSSFGMPLLSKKASKNSSFGLPLLTGSGWSLSGMIGMPMLRGSRRK